MNRFFRSALFPLIVIVLLVYLASQTLMRGGGKETKVSTYGLTQAIKNNPSGSRTSRSTRTSRRSASR